jgi:ABC-type antimicrobial peptide transport system, permease component
MIENIRLSFQGIWSHKLRSFLTMLGIIIGIASLISIVSTIKGTNEQIKQNLIGSGNNVVKVQIYQNDWVYDPTYEGLPSNIGVVSDMTAEELRGLENTEAVTVYNYRTDHSNGLYYKNSQFSGFEIFGIEDDYFSTCGYIVKQGRNFVPKDFSEFRHVMIIDNTTASSLFPGENPLGKIIEYQSLAFVVVGIVSEKRTFEPVINTIDDYYTYLGNSASGKIFIPHVCWPDIFAYDEPQEVAIRAKNTDVMASVGKNAAEILNLSNGITNEIQPTADPTADTGVDMAMDMSPVTSNQLQYKADDVLQKAKELQELSNATNIQLMFIASISLLVGGIGVMNIMLVSVTERTREIGLKKAIGAKKPRILWQFLTEAAVLTSIGGILGVICGIILSQLMAEFADMPVAISYPAAFVAVAFSMGIGILFGLIPSVKASNLNPIDALRHE